MCDPHHQVIFFGHTCLAQHYSGLTNIYHATYSTTKKVFIFSLNLHFFQSSFGSLCVAAWCFGQLFAYLISLWCYDWSHMSAPIDRTLDNGKTDRLCNMFIELYSDDHFLSIFGYIVIQFGLFM